MPDPPIDWAKQGGLVPCIAQDVATGAVLMMAWMSPEALARTLETGVLHFFSRSRGRLWKKGEESGHTLGLVSLHVDCDADTLLALVVPSGPACHTGADTCWNGSGRAVHAGGPDALAAPLPALPALWRTIQDRKARPAAGSWTNQLLADPGLAIDKVLEEAAEVGRAARGDPAEDDLPHEVADLLYHTMVLMAARGHDWREALERLRDRRR